MELAWKVIRGVSLTAFLTSGAWYVSPPQYRDKAVGGALLLLAFVTALSFVSLERYFLVSLMTAFVSAGPMLLLNIPNVAITVRGWFGNPQGIDPSIAKHAIADPTTSAGWDAVIQIVSTEGLKQIAVIIWIILVFWLIMRLLSISLAGRKAKTNINSHPQAE